MGALLHKEILTGLSVLSVSGDILLLFWLYLDAVVSCSHSIPTFFALGRSLSGWRNSCNRPLSQMFADVFWCICARQQIPESGQSSSRNGNTPLFVTLSCLWEIILNYRDVYSSSFKWTKICPPRYLACQYSSACTSPCFPGSTQIHLCFSGLTAPTRSVFLAWSPPNWQEMHCPPWKYVNRSIKLFQSHSHVRKCNVNRAITWKVLTHWKHQLNRSPTPHSHSWPHQTSSSPFLQSSSRNHVASSPVEIPAVNSFRIPVNIKVQEAGFTV